VSELADRCACFMGCDPPDGGGAEAFYIVVYPELTVYGHTTDAFTRTRYPEDWPLTLSGRERGREYGCWHSVMCAAGELSSHDVGSLRPITFEQWDRARSEGWPQDPIDGGGLTTVSPIAATASFDADGQITDWWDSHFGKDSPHDPRKQGGDG
jgi:hypothetical protein